MPLIDETEFNRLMRTAIRAEGLSVVHVREADIPGPWDLVIWEGPYLLAWVELKIDDGEVRPAQREFYREHLRNARNSYVMRYMTQEAGAILVFRGLANVAIDRTHLMHGGWLARFTAWNS